MQDLNLHDKTMPETEKPIVRGYPGLGKTSILLMVEETASDRTDGFHCDDLNPSSKCQECPHQASFMIQRETMFQGE
jgi:hypothetical protein